MMRELHLGSRRKLAGRVPTIFLRRAWRSRVNAGPDGLDPRAYEVAVIVHLRRGAHGRGVVPRRPSPLGPLALTGDYLWSDADVPRERFRPSRTSRFRPDAFRAAQSA